MRAEGHSLQVIADAVNVGVETVRRNTPDSAFSNEKAEITGKDGKKYPAKYKPREEKAPRTERDETGQPSPSEERSPDTETCSELNTSTGKDGAN